MEASLEDRILVLHSVTTLVTDELLLSHVRGEESPESKSFMEVLMARDPELVIEAAEHHVLRSEASWKPDEAKSCLLDMLRYLFQVQFKDHLLIPMAFRLGMLPDEFGAVAYAVDAQGRKYVKGTRIPWPVDAPLGKMEALFDSRACFDSLRWCFVVHADPDGSVRVFTQCLREQCTRQDAEPDMRALHPLLESLQEFATHERAPEMPDFFLQRAWSSYLLSLASPDYWKSADELLLLCVLADRPVAIFQSIATTLSLVSNYMPHGRTPVSVKVTNQNSRRVRGHFERLVPDVTSPEAWVESWSLLTEML